MVVLPEPASPTIPTFISSNPQILPGHLLGLWYSQQSQHRRSDVLERTSFAQPSMLIINQEQLHRIGCMRRERPAGCRIDHLFSVPVIRRYYGRAALFSDYIDHAAHVCIQSLDRLDSGLQDAGMSHHIRVGVVDYKDFGLIFADSL